MANSPERKEKKRWQKEKKIRETRKTNRGALVYTYAGKYSPAEATVDITTSISRRGGALYFKAKKRKEKVETLSLYIKRGKV